MGYYYRQERLSIFTGATEKRVKYPTTLFDTSSFKTWWGQGRRFHTPGTAYQLQSRSESSLWGMERKEEQYM